MLKMELPEPFNKLKSTETQESVRYSEFVQSFCEALVINLFEVKYYEFQKFFI
jgi:hypothetical protein